MQFVFPSLELIDKYSEVAMPLLLRARIARAEAESLEELRAGLLPQLISGDLRIPEEMLVP
jgi:hypothetical protein